MDPLSLFKKKLKATNMEAECSNVSTSDKITKPHSHAHTYTRTHSVLTTIIDRPHRAAYPTAVQKKKLRRKTGCPWVYLLEYSTASP